VSQLQLNSKTRIEGFGYDSWFKQKASTTGPMFVLSDANVEQTVLRNIRIMGNKTVQSAANAGISYDNTGFTGGTYSDPHHIIENVIVELCKGNGVELIGKASECHLTNVFVNLCDGHGFYLDWADNYLTDCVASDSGQAGFYLTANASNTRLTGCKAFFNGSLMAAATDRGEGFYLLSASGNELTGCEAQDNYGHGFNLSSAFDNVLIGCGADANGQFAGLTTSAGFNLLNSSRNKIVGYSKNRSGKTTQDYGVYLDFTTGTNTANDINLAVTGNNTGAINVWTVSTSGTNNAIVLGASNGGMQRLGTGATPDITNGSVCYYVMTSGMTVNNVTNRWPGMRISFLLEQDGTGGRVVTWNSAYKLDPAWVPDTTASKANTAEFIFDGTEYKMIGGRTGLPA
jgi:parallel beta-helix repeat protein